MRLATVHKVKGLEWPHVIVYDATEGLMPHILAEDLEEERRVFHVAITRCSESVTVICGEDSSPYPAETRSPARKTRTPGPAGPPAPAGSRRTPGKQPTTAAPVSERVQPTHPGTSWPVPTGQKKPRQDGSRSRRTRR
ncbi:3'-5' exonuclease [Candidatus Poriferisocius sp.]|uniref:3'-5' exonuclease n=2 Tax=Candidatus Poriferisocius sp. TaxID=3101276 RepID=UPI003B522F0A